MKKSFDIPVDELTQSLELSGIVFWIRQIQPREKFVYVSPAFEEIWDRPREDLYEDGRLWLDAILPEDRERVEQAFHSFLFEGSGFDVRYCVTSPSGAVRWIWDQGIDLERSPSGEPRKVSGFAMDITARKVAQKSLKSLWKLSQSFDKTLQELCDMVLDEIVDLTQSQCGFFGFLNDDENLLSLNALSSSAKADCAIRDRKFHFPVDNSGLWGNVMRNRKPFITNDYSREKFHKRGTPPGHVALERLMVVPVFSKDRIVALGALANRASDYEEDDAQEITAYLNTVQFVLGIKKAEEDLLKERAFSRAVLENTQDGIVACDKDGVLSLFNRATREFHGLPQKNLPAKEWAKNYNLYLNDGQTPMKKKDIPLFRALLGERVQNEEMVIAPKEGKKRTLLASGQRLEDEQGNVLGAVVSMHDITERKKTEGMLREAYSNLENKVEQRTAELKVANARLEKKISEHEAAQETIRFKSVQLRERNKELNCHYVISQLAEQKERDLDGLLQGVIEALPVSYMYPGVACARLTMREKHYLSGAFAPTRWRQAQSITVNNQKVGEIEVFYLVEKPETDEGPFLKEERILINAVAERVGRFIEHDESEKKRREAEKSREQLIQTLQEKLEEINTLKGILPMCSFCKNIRDDKGNWELLEEYVSKYTQADVSHGICPECAQKHYPNMEFDSLDERKKTVPESQE